MKLKYYLSFLSNEAQIYKGDVFQGFSFFYPSVTNHSTPSDATIT